MSHKKRKHADGGGGGVNLSIIITPFLDMAFQLLAFFIMTYNPSSFEGHVDGKLLPPKAAIVGPKSASKLEDTPLPELPDDPGDALTVYVRAVQKGLVEGDRVDGQPSSYEIRRPDEAQGGSAPIGGPPLTLEEGKKVLFRDLEKQFKSGLMSKTNIKLEGHPDLRHRYLMEIYDVCKMAGFKNVSFVAPVGAK